jgi:hypothetical protein
MSEAITPTALETLFTGARTHNGWQDLPVSDALLREVYDLMKWGPRPPTVRLRGLCSSEAPKEREAAPGALQRQSGENPHRPGHGHRGLGR